MAKSGTKESGLPSKIVVGTDGSETAERAVRRAAALAKAVDAQLIIVTAYNNRAPSGVAAAGMAAIAWLAAAGPRAAVTGALPPTPKFAEVANIVLSRCSMCHAAAPVWTGIVAPPKGVMLDTDEEIHVHAPLIEIVAVRSNAMPPGNVTEMTDRERLVLASWLAAGATAK